MISIFGASRLADSAAWRRASRMGSMRCEWKACDVASVLDLIPSFQKARQHLADGRFVAGNDDALRPVQSGDGDLTLVGCQPAAHLRLGGEDGGHQSAGRQRLHQPGPLGDQRQAVLQREHARHAGRGELAHAVAQHRGRARSPNSARAWPGRIRGRTSPAACSPSGPRREPACGSSRESRDGPVATAVSRRSGRSPGGRSAAFRTGRVPCRRTARLGR